MRAVFVIVCAFCGTYKERQPGHLLTTLLFIIVSVLCFSSSLNHRKSQRTGPRLRTPPSLSAHSSNPTPTHIHTLPYLTFPNTYTHITFSSLPNTHTHRLVTQHQPCIDQLSSEQARKKIQDATKVLPAREMLIVLNTLLTRVLRQSKLAQYERPSNYSTIISFSFLCFL